MEGPALLSFAQLCATSYHRVLGASQISAPQDQRRDSRTIPARGSKKPLPNHKVKGVAAVVICADLGEDEEENPALLAAAITTL